MNGREAYAWLLNHHRETAYLESMEAVLGWDQRTYIPAKGHGHRAEQMAVLARLLHARATDPAVAERLAVVQASELMNDPVSVEAVNVREWRRAYDRAMKIPERLAVALAEATARGESAWEQAKPKNDWNGFRPHLERIVALRREQAEALDRGDEPYDALLDEFEPGETARSLEPIFSRLQGALVHILQRIQESAKRPELWVIQGRFPRADQEAFARQVAARLGYDFEAGRLDESAHPFSTSIGPGDARITTRYDEAELTMALLGTVHEAGHALYEQGLDPDHWGTPMGRAVSLGIHESQSRTWENLVGRSRGFWNYFYPKAQTYFPALSGVSLDTFHRLINRVRPTLIRTEADEVTYNLHVMLRFDLELALIRGDLTVQDLPGAWNDRVKTYLGLDVPDYRQGVMQDIHWSGGAIGYFPTYTLGNLYAAQFFAQAEKDLGTLEEQFARGDFAPFLEWLRAKIHRQGSRYRPRDLVKVVTGEERNPDYLITYLEHKFSELYEL